MWGEIEMQKLVSSFTPDETAVRFPVDLCLQLIGFKDFLS